MQLTIRDASRFLNALETTIHRWIKHGRLPAYRLENQFRFNRAELLEWATAQKLQVSPEIFESEEEPRSSRLLSDALRAGGMFYDIGGTDQLSVLRAVVDTMRLPGGVSRHAILEVLQAREAKGSMVMHDGIAIPPVRNPTVLPVERPLVSLCFLAMPVAFGAVDGKPLFAMFFVLSPTVRVHLRLVSELSFVLRDPAVRSAVERRASPEEILGQIARIES